MTKGYPTSSSIAFQGHGAFLAGVTPSLDNHSTYNYFKAASSAEVYPLHAINAVSTLASEESKHLTAP